MEHARALFVGVDEDIAASDDAWEVRLMTDRGAINDRDSDHNAAWSGESRWLQELGHVSKL